MPKLAHHVFFTLKDRRPQAVESHAASCQRYLDDHEGLIGFSVGTRVPDLNREVNHDFDVSIHCIFENRAAHDAYQSSERHVQFITETKENWASVLVCDSDLID